MITENKDRINIKDLVIDEPKTEEIVFDPNSELSTAEFGSLVDFLNAVKFQSPEDYPDLAYKTAVMFPDRKENMDLDEEALKITTTFDALPVVTAKRRLTSFYRNAKILFPDIFRNKMESNPMFFGELTKSLKENVQQKDYNPRTLESLVAFKIAFPDHFNSIGLEESDWTEIKQKAKNFSDNVMHIGNAKALFPNHQHEQLFKNQDLIHLKNLVNEVRARWTPRLYIDWGYDLLLATATRIDIDKDGIKVSPETISFKEKDVSPLPEARRF